MVDFSTVITDVKGAPIKTVSIDGGALLAAIREIAAAGSEAQALAKKIVDEVPASDNITLRDIAVNVLGLQFKDEQSLSGKEKMRRGLLAQRIHQAAEPLALRAEDVASLKALIAKAYGPLIVMRAWMLLDPASAEATD